MIRAEVVLAGRWEKREADARIGAPVQEDGRDERQEQRPDEDAESEQEGRRLEETQEDLHAYPPPCPARTRGSSHPMRTSTLKFAARTQTVIKSVHPVMTG